MLEKYTDTVQTEESKDNQDLWSFEYSKFNNNTTASHFVADQIFYGLISSVEDLDRFKLKVPHLKDVADSLCENLIKRKLLAIDGGQFNVNRAHWYIPQTKESLLQSYPDTAKALARRAILDKTKNPNDKLSTFNILSFSDNEEIEERVYSSLKRLYSELVEISKDDDKLKAKNKNWNVIINSGSLKEEDF